MLPRITYLVNQTRDAGLRSISRPGPSTSTATSYPAASSSRFSDRAPIPINADRGDGLNLHRRWSTPIQSNFHRSRPDQWPSQAPPRLTNLMDVTNRSPLTVEQPSAAYRKTFSLV